MFLAQRTSAFCRPGQSSRSLKKAFDIATDLLDMNEDKEGIPGMPEGPPHEAPDE
jgi:hypothetical protein